MSALVRPALPEDAPRMALLDAGASLWPWRESQYLRCCATAEDSAERALLLEVDAVLQGFVVYAREFDDGSIYNIVVADTARRQGFGLRLLQAAVDAMVASGARRCLLEVRKSNSAARKLYEQMGFHVDGMRRNYYPLPTGREDAVLMSLDL